MGLMLGLLEYMYNGVVVDGFNIHVFLLEDLYI
jgi:hypothetical protein